MSLNFHEYRQFDALGLADAMRRGDVSRREVMDATMARIADVNPRVNAVTYLHPGAADNAALQAIDAQAPFAGVPYLIKDLHAPVAGMPLTHGSRLFAGDTHPFDSETVARLRRAGFVILGRTASPEFGMSGSTEPASTGPTCNPWNLAHSAGGSSGGAGAAVASGMLPASHATDSGGSIRIPASCNGLVGLKPTRGLIATGPHRGEASHGLSHEHAVTRSVRDCAAILDATVGPDVGAPYFTRPTRAAIWLRWRTRRAGCASRSRPPPSAARRSTPSARRRSQPPCACCRAWAIRWKKAARCSMARHWGRPAERCWSPGCRRRLPRASSSSGARPARTSSNR
jgi:amidase